MKKINEIFKKQGGFKLIKQYIRSGGLFIAIVEFLFLGRDKTALEILRLATQYKAKQKLKKKYNHILVNFDKNFDKNLKSESSKKVWICWFQGINNAPDIVKKCYESISVHLKDREIILITSENMNQYVKFPDFIVEKWQKEIISNAHMADLLRLELLTRYGGLWIDATVFCTSSNIPDYYFDSDLFLFQNLKPGKNGNSSVISNWLISAKSNNKILLATKELCYEYWKHNNQLIDYFFFHYFMTMVLEFYEEDWKKIVPVSNSTPHILLLRLFDKYDERIWDTIKKQICFHKLSYKFDESKLELNDTYYSKIMK